MEKIKIHCLTNPVTMQDVANILLAAGGSPIMGQDPEEAEEIARLCQAVLQNTGVPDERKFQACILAGKTANMLGHPVVLDPGRGRSFRFSGKGTLQTSSGSPSGCDPLQCRRSVDFVPLENRIHRIHRIPRKNVDRIPDFIRV